MNALDHGQVVCTAFLDLKKVFDSLDQILFLECLSIMGVHGFELSWFTDYLSQCV